MSEERNTVEQHYTKLEERMTNVETRLAVAESNIQDIKEDISSIKSNTTWILRLLIGAFIMALIALVIKDPSIL
ncbi:chromosome segregation ATPase [Pullulanibacillus pueri]|uniref:Hemolysin XhlA n=1 Tax=Pullulanibacillus pueri TaxID=1437324 RepID=A0A8J2ZXM9_9BACL|nr:hemolysin XhlA family protein [Pullulanibacillus pueri]MBM7681934.1 chromosome segregation ATPase [Pullulanibacillus pueri]GGH83504.1 hypothetical protein GCM10007096_24470 [Pullulanibacillus pueri]